MAQAHKARKEVGLAFGIILTEEPGLCASSCLSSQEQRKVSSSNSLSLETFLSITDWPSAVICLFPDRSLLSVGPVTRLSPAQSHVYPRATQEPNGGGAVSQRRCGCCLGQMKISKPRPSSAPSRPAILMLWKQTWPISTSPSLHMLQMLSEMLFSPKSWVACPIFLCVIPFFRYRPASSLSANFWE